MIYLLAFHDDAMLDLDSTDPKVMEAYIKQGEKYYEKEFSKTENVTVLDPDPKWRHKFESSCYQKVAQDLVKRYNFLEYGKLRRYRRK